MIYCLTPTGNRPQGLALLGEYLNAQTYAGALVWIVVDDCDPQTRIPRVRQGIEVVSVRPDWRWHPGQNTQAACLLAGLDHAQNRARLLILEDDDAYLPPYIETMQTELETAELVGERVSRYYNVATSRHALLPSATHASLAATGVQGRGFDALRAVCRASKKGLDMKLWREFTGTKRLLDSTNVIGIKGLPGRAGIGVGHRRTFGRPDNGDVLGGWLGRSRAAAYDQFREAT